MASPRSEPLRFRRRGFRRRRRSAEGALAAAALAGTFVAVRANPFSDFVNRVRSALPGAPAAPPAPFAPAPVPALQQPRVWSSDVYGEPDRYGGSPAQVYGEPDGYGGSPTQASGALPSAASGALPSAFLPGGGAPTEEEAPQPSPSLAPSPAPSPAPTPDFEVLPGTPTGFDPIEEKEVLKEEPWELANLGYGADADIVCAGRFQVPLEPPLHATDLNGMQLPDTCFLDSEGPHHVFALGDWGGVLHHDGRVVPADHRSLHFQSHERPFVVGADDVAQQNVAKQMRARAPVSQPDFVLNVGDNFYWGGVEVKCGAPAYKANDASGQWQHIFEEMYAGPGLDGKQWLGVLGNHDYGGWMFTMGWDQAISYTWADALPTSTGRWLTPAQYYSSRVRYSDFSVDYFFVDTNVWDAFEPDDQPSHNMCSRQHNPEIGATCGQVGPISVDDCPGWFKRLWKTEVQWLKDGLAASDATWQVVVTHFPPEGAWGEDIWKSYSFEYGIDLIVVGHRHRQSIAYSENNPLGPTGVIITGGGGGITSESTPDAAGADDQYGFVDISFLKDEIKVEMISHGGHVRSTTCITPRAPQQQAPAAFAGSGTSMCEKPPPKAPPPEPPSKAPLAEPPSKAPPPGSVADMGAVVSNGDARHSDGEVQLPLPEPRRRLAADAGGSDADNAGWLQV